jgi:hypothetical protein
MQWKATLRVPSSILVVDPAAISAISDLWGTKPWGSTDPGNLSPWRSHSPCEVLHQDFLAMQLPESRFGGILANASLFHVPSQELPRVLRELCKTRLVNLLSGALMPDTGGVRLGTNLAPAILDQLRETLAPEQSLTERRVPKILILAERPRYRSTSTCHIMQFQRERDEPKFPGWWRTF